MKHLMVFAAVAAFVAATVGCGFIDAALGVEQYEAPVMEQAMAPDGTPLFAEDGKPIMRPKLDADGKPVVELAWRRSASGGPAGWVATVAGNWVPWLPAALGGLAAFWMKLRKNGSDKLAVKTYDQFKAVVAGIVSFFDKNPGHTFDRQQLYDAIDNAAKLYTDNSEEFRMLVSTLKAEIRGEAAAAAS